jgi:diaminopimelate epimerase
MKFTKMHGAGNDYVFVDCFSQPVPSDPSELARRISDRHFGVGSDGLILICPSSVADARMWMFNADGSEAEMCGNGIRCVAKYIYERGLCSSPEVRIETAAGVKQVRVFLERGKVHRARVEMGWPVLRPAEIPTTLRALSGNPDDPVIDVPMEVSGVTLKVTCVSMGNPHAVIFVEELQDDWVQGLGPAIERSPYFPRRTNVEFIQVISPKEVRMRVWERGSGETLACGTGAAATCVAGVISGRTERSILVHALGGDLELEWSAADAPVYLTGPAEEVFTGEWLGPV